MLRLNQINHITKKIYVYGLGEAPGESSNGKNSGTPWILKPPIPSASVMFLTEVFASSKVIFTAPSADIAN